MKYDAELLEVGYQRRPRRKAIKNSIHGLLEMVAEAIEKMSDEEKTEMRRELIKSLLPNRLADGQWIN